MRFLTVCKLHFFTQTHRPHAVQIGTYLSLKCIWHGERTGDPTIGINHMRWYTTYNARNRIANELWACDDQTEGQQHHRCEHIMQPKYGVVDLNILWFEISFKSAQ